LLGKGTQREVFIRKKGSFLREETKSFLRLGEKKPGFMHIRNRGGKGGNCPREGVKGKKHGQVSEKGHNHPHHRKWRDEEALEKKKEKKVPVPKKKRICPHRGKRATERKLEEIRRPREPRQKRRTANDKKGGGSS